MSASGPRVGVITFPGSLDDRDALYSLETVLGQVVVPLWHKDRDLHGVEAVILPGGFSYGDYLRCGAIARFSPVMSAVERFAAGAVVSAPWPKPSHPAARRLRRPLSWPRPSNPDVVAASSADSAGSDRLGA